MTNDPPPKLVKYFEKGVAAEESGRFRAARTCFIKAAQYSKGKRRAYYLCRAASCEEELGNLTEAMRLLRKAERYDPTGGLIQGYVGSIQLELERPKLAERALRKSIEIKAYPETYIFLADSLGRQGRREEQKKCYEAALRIEPDYEEAHFNLGLHCRFNDRLHKAEKHFRRAIEIDSKYAVAYAELGHILIIKGSYLEARRVLRRSVRLNPEYYWSRIYLGLANYFLRRLKEAQEQYLEAVRIAPDDPFANSLLGDFLSAERRGNPEPYLTKALSLAPNDEVVLYYMGKHMHRESRDDEAARYLRKAARKGHERAKELLRKLDLENSSRCSG